MNIKKSWAWIGVAVLAMAIPAAAGDFTFVVPLELHRIHEGVDRVVVYCNVYSSDRFQVADKIGGDRGPIVDIPPSGELVQDVVVTFKLGVFRFSCG